MNHDYLKPIIDGGALALLAYAIIYLGPKGARAGNDLARWTLATIFAELREARKESLEMLAEVTRTLRSVVEKNGGPLPRPPSPPSPGHTPAAED